MNMKKMFLPLFAILFVGLTVAQCPECFSGKSLDELREMYRAYRNTYKEGIVEECTVEYKKVQAIEQKYANMQPMVQEAVFACKKMR